MKPLVSVIIPAYHSEKTIEKSIDSVLQQKVPLEIFVLNNDEDDSLCDVIAKYQKNPDFHYIKNETNLGASGSRNRGVQMAKGAYVAFLDSDDWWEEGKLEKQLQLMEKTGAILCSSGRELVTPEGARTGRVIGAPEKITYHRLLTHNSINCSSVVVKTEVIRRFPMEHEDSHEDYITWLKILKQYKIAVAVPEPLLFYRLSASGKSGNKLHSAKMTFRVYRYLGFGPIRSGLCFAAYALNGVRKYTGSYLYAGRKRTENKS